MAAFNSIRNTAIVVAAFSMRTIVHIVVAADERGFLRNSGKTSNNEEDFREAMGTVMGCGGSVESEHLRAVELAVQPMWNVLPKNQYDLVEWRMVRYVAHRYFVQKSNILVRGFEPMRRVDASDMGTADILSKHMPFADAVHTKHKTSNGFSLADTIQMLATLERLISNSERDLLTRVYEHVKISPMQHVGRTGFKELVEAYMLHWMVDDDRAVMALLKNTSRVELFIPKWTEIQGFLEGIMREMDYKRRQDPRSGDFESILRNRYSFEDAHNVISTLTNTFAAYWESECQHIKQSLLVLDKTRTGRVKLADFYGANADGEWRFGESETYLRELGALDESSSWRGKQVIVPNYMQGANNCIVTTAHYLVCCAHECEEVLNEIEQFVAGPLASPADVLSVVFNMTNFDDEIPKVDSVLNKQLFSIANAHGGTVPLHGRLFAQWLHYVFPRECPFPHKSGMVVHKTPNQFGDSSIASDVEVSMHAGARNDNVSFEAEYEEAQKLTQWSEEEELIVDYSSELRALRGSNQSVIMKIIAVVFLLILIGGAAIGHEKLGSSSVFEQKVHLV